MLLGGITIDTLYQFWIHTRAIGRMGPLEWVLNTPSHHRVHHGIDPEYLDKNYAGIFIFWDRLFGTFEPERREPVYGTVKVTPTYDPVWANACAWADLAAASQKTRSLVDKIRVWLAPPEWRPVDLGGPVARQPANPAAHPRYNPLAPKPVRVYVAAAFALVAAATIVYLWDEATASRGVLAAAAGALLLSGAAYGALLERKAWAWRLEAIRLAASAALILWIALVV